MSVLGKEDWKGMFELLSNAKQVVSSIQEVARKVTHYAKLSNNTSKLSGMLLKENLFLPLGYFL